MATDLERLTNQRSYWIEHLETEAKKVRDSGKPKPTYSINGQSVSWMEYFNGVNKIIADLTKQIADEEGADEGPYEIHTRAYT